MKKASKIFYIFSGIFGILTIVALLGGAFLYFALGVINGIVGIINKSIDWSTILGIIIVVLLIGLFLSTSILCLIATIFAFIGIKNKKAINIFNIVLAVFCLLACMALTAFAIFMLAEAIYTIVMVIALFMTFMPSMSTSIEIWLLDILELIVISGLSMSLVLPLFLSALGIGFEWLFTLLGGIFGLISNRKKKEKASHTIVETKA